MIDFMPLACNYDSYFFDAQMYADVNGTSERWTHFPLDQLST